MVHPLAVVWVWVCYLSTIDQPPRRTEGRRSPRPVPAARNAPPRPAAPHVPGPPLVRHGSPRPPPALFPTSNSIPTSNSPMFHSAPFPCIPGYPPFLILAFSNMLEDFPAKHFGNFHTPHVSRLSRNTPPYRFHGSPPAGVYIKWWVRIPLPNIEPCPAALWCKTQSGTVFI